MRSSARSQSSRGPWRRRGAAAVEFAVIAPLFLLLLAGIIEFGQAFRVEHATSNASRRAARTATCNGATVNVVYGSLIGRELTLSGGGGAHADTALGLLDGSGGKVMLVQ